MKKLIIVMLVGIAGTFTDVSTTYSQESGAEEASSEERERIIVNVEHLEVSSIAQAVSELSHGDLRLFADSTTNRLVIDGPKEGMPGVVGLIRELDRAMPQVNVRLVEVALELEIDENLKSGASKDVQDELERLLKSGKAKVVNRVSVAAMNNTSSRVQQGAAKPNATGGNGRGKTFQLQEVGTIFECTPRVSADGVLVQYTYERSDLVNSEDGNESPKTRTSMRSSSVLGVPSGESVIIGGLRLSEDDKTVQWKLILSADVVRQ